MIDIGKLMHEKDNLLVKRQMMLDGLIEEHREYTDTEQAEVKTLQKEIDEYDKRIKEAQDIQNQRVGNTPAEALALIQGYPTEPGTFGQDGGLSRDFQLRGYRTEHKNFAEFVNAARFKPESLRVMSAGVGTSGGFTVPDNFVPQIFKVDPESSIVRPRAQMVPGLPDSPDAVSNIPALDHSSGIHGGISVSWIAEAGEKPATEPELIEIILDPAEVAGHLVITDKLLRNNTANLSIFLTKVFREALFAAEDRAFLTGTGVGMPLGILNAPATIFTVRAGAGAIAFADVILMISAFTPDSWTKGTWVANVSTLPELMAMVDAGNHRVFKGKDDMRGLPPTLFGIPIIFTGRLPVLGTAGDICLCDFNYYLVKQGFGPSIEASPHLYFKENKTIIKAFYNVDGEPWIQAPLTLEDGATVVSPFVALAA